MDGSARFGYSHLASDQFANLPQPIWTKFMDGMFIDGAVCVCVLTNFEDKKHSVIPMEPDPIFTRFRC